MANISSSITSQPDFQQVFQAFGGSLSDLSGVDLAQTTASGGDVASQTQPLVENTAIGDTLSTTSLPFTPQESVIGPAIDSGAPQEHPMIAIMGQMLQLMSMMLTQMMGQGGYMPEPQPAPAPAYSNATNLSPYGYSMSYGSGAYGSSSAPISSPVSEQTPNNVSQEFTPVASEVGNGLTPINPRILNGPLSNTVQTGAEQRAVLGR